jgi:hypothetical protein
MKGIFPRASAPLSEIFAEEPDLPKDPLAGFRPNELLLSAPELTMLRHLGLTALVTCLGSLACPAAQKKPTPEQVRWFESKIRPLLADRCIKCHGPNKQKGELRLDSRAALVQGGEQGPAAVPGAPEKSLLITAVQYTRDDLQMPPRKKLSSQQIADLVRWVKMGAPWPATGGAATTTRRGDFKISARDRAHWAFQPIKRARAPRVRDQAWPANPIDTFVLARLEAKGLRPNPPASKRELIRRLFYDLTGLPPAPREVETFVADASPYAYQRLVDRLLESPHYGEKWGRHWLDLVRFAETNSYERDGAKPNAWRYRDYVIRSFNQDKPYDQFVREQLAGDELPGNRADALIATGYYRLGIWDDEPTDREQARYDGLDDIVATTGQVFLGLTFDCARCHDHKIDPIPQQDYCRLLSFFHNINHYSNGGPGDQKPIGAGNERALSVTEAGNHAPDTFVLIRGSAHARGARVKPAFPVILGGAKPVIPSPGPQGRTTGRRLALANWIVSPDNRLAARVMANRLWQYHFGRGIVRSPNDFGLQGDRPTHPELFDWLAGELVTRGWRLKALHRMILLSSAYRVSSRTNPEALAADPANDLFWRFDRHRLTAEEIRDSILAAGGSLNSKMYGPGVFPGIPGEVLAGQSMPGNGWGKSPPAEQNRRSVYIHVKRSLLTPLLERFDVAETDRSTPVRFTTTQPTQALLMLNSDFMSRQAAVLARRIRQEVGSAVDQQVRRALHLAMSRTPNRAEVARGIGLIEKLQKEDGASADMALRYFCLVVLNLNEFVYLD